MLGRERHSERRGSAPRERVRQGRGAQGVSVGRASREKGPSTSEEIPRPKAGPDTPGRAEAPAGRRGWSGGAVGAQGAGMGGAGRQQVCCTCGARLARLGLAWGSAEGRPGGGRPPLDVGGLFPDLVLERLQEAAPHILYSPKSAWGHGFARGLPQDHRSGASRRVWMPGTRLFLLCGDPLPHLPQGGPAPLSPRRLGSGSSPDLGSPPSDPFPRRGLALLGLLRPPPPTWQGPRRRPSRPHPSRAAVPGALEAAPPAPQRRPLLPQKRSGRPAGLRLHRPGRGPRTRARSGGLGPRRGSEGRSVRKPQPRPRPGRLSRALAPPQPHPELLPSPLGIPRSCQGPAPSPPSASARPLRVAKAPPRPAPR